MTKYILALILFFGISVSAIASEYPKPTKTSESTMTLALANQDLIEANILANLGSSIDQVRGDALQLIIDIKNNYPAINMDYAVFPLMSLLKGDENENVRILSAMALSLFDSDRGHFTIRQASKFDSSVRVQKICKVLSLNR
jgi:hypothetical protein